VEGVVAMGQEKAEEFGWLTENRLHIAVDCFLHGSIAYAIAHYPSGNTQLVTAESI
jgi:hypothetical protein